MGGLVLQAVLDGVGVALSPLPVLAAIGLLRTRRALSNSLNFILGWVVHLAVLSAVLLAAVQGQRLLGGVDLSRPLAVVLLGIGTVLAVLALLTWRGRTVNEGRLAHWLGRLDDLSPRAAFLAGLLAVSLNVKNAALTLSTVHGIQSANAGVVESVATITLFIVVATLGIAAPAVLAATLPGRAGSVFDVWRLRLAQRGRAIAAWVLLGAGLLLIVSALVTLRG